MPDNGGRGLSPNRLRHQKQIRFGGSRYLRTECRLLISRPQSQTDGILEHLTSLTFGDVRDLVRAIRRENLVRLLAKSAAGADESGRANILPRKPHYITVSK